MRKNVKVKENLGDLIVYRGIILKWTINTSYGDVDWIKVARDKALEAEFCERDNGSAVSIKVGNSLR
jgi:hypothetical protein